MAFFTELEQIICCLATKKNVNNQTIMGKNNKAVILAFLGFKESKLQ